MAYVSIEDFKTGLDRRRPSVAGAPGSCYELINAHVTRGGDIERRKRFVPVYDLPADTFGLKVINNKAVVFGSKATPAQMPPQVLYQRLEHPVDNTINMIRLIHSEVFDGQVYAIAEFEDGSIHHFYNGQYLSAWESIANSSSETRWVALALAKKIDDKEAYVASATGLVVTITAAVPGTAFTYDSGTTNGDVDQTDGITELETQANVVGVDETLATGSFDITGGDPNIASQVTSVTVDGVELLAEPVDWLLSNDWTAVEVAQAINSGTSSPDYEAEASGNTVTIKGVTGSGATPNGKTVAATATNAITIASVSNMSGGQDAVEAVAQSVEFTLSGVFEAADLYWITIDGTKYQVAAGAPALGTMALTFQGKVYSVAQSLVRFSALNTPTKWVDDGNDPPGAGFVNMANQDSRSELLYSLAPYQGNMAVFARNSIQIWYMDVDPAANKQLQSLENTGTIAPRTVVTYGNNDTFYLGDTGIRSLRARDSSNAAYVHDVGTQIDPLVRDLRRTLRDEEVVEACGIMEPVDGRFMMALDERIFVFSFFPGSKIAAWSIYEPGFRVEEFDILRDQVVCRAGDTIYLLGGISGLEYPEEGEAPITVELPFMTGGKPAHHKTLTGLDLGGEGMWSCEVLLDPRDRSIRTGAVNVIASTYPSGRVPLSGFTTHFAPRLTLDGAGYAVLANVVVHYEEAYAQ